jgi:hypothetical protein
MLDGLQFAQLTSLQLNWSLEAFFSSCNSCSTVLTGIPKSNTVLSVTFRLLAHRSETSSLRRLMFLSRMRTVVTTSARAVTIFSCTALQQVHLVVTRPTFGVERNKDAKRNLLHELFTYVWRALMMTMALHCYPKVWLSWALLRESSNAKHTRLLVLCCTFEEVSSFFRYHVLIDSASGTLYDVVFGCTHIRLGLLSENVAGGRLKVAFWHFNLPQSLHW